MDIRITTVAGLGALWVLSAAAQNTASAPIPDKAAMERMQQQADGPKRRILEAAARAKPAAAPVAAAPAPAAAAARAEAPEPVLATLSSAVSPLSVPATSVSAVPVAAPLELASRGPALIEMPAAGPATAALPPLKLVTMVEPDLPPRLFTRKVRRTEVVVGLTVNADGSVSEVTARSPGNRMLEPPILEAVRQWRYEAQSAPRQHTVVLVVSPS